jgi:hypothetical protein
MRLRHPRPRLRRAGVVLLALAVLVCTPVVVVVLASGRTAAPAARAARPGAPTLLRPSAPFAAGRGDGVRPDGIGCEPTDPARFRARAHLDAFADGERITVPAGIGVLASCRYWVHTLAPDGVIHIPAPLRRRFTLGDLFDIWGAPLTRHRALGFTLGPGRRLRVLVDGRRVSGDPRRIALADGREIALVIGRAPAHVPGSFTFR